MLKRKKGFTLIELMIVIAILAILTLVALPNFLDYYGTDNDTQIEQTIEINEDEESGDTL